MTLIPKGLDHATGPVPMKLSPQDSAWADEIAAVRFGKARKRGAPVLLNMDAAFGDRVGVRGEMAVHRAYGAPWIPLREVRDYNDPDVGGVDVRATSKPGNGMPVREKNPDESSQVFVVVDKNNWQDCIIVGWCFGYDAKRDEFWHDADQRGPGYWSIPQAVLWDPAWLAIERATCPRCGHDVHVAWHCAIPDGRDPMDICECPG